MSPSGTVYDLGEIDHAPAAAAPVSEPAPVADGPRATLRRMAVPRVAVSRPSLIDPIADTLNLVLPGTGQMLRGRWASGFALASLVGLVLALGWAVLESLPRLDATLPLLGYPREAGIWALAGLFGALALLHITAISLRNDGAPPAPHPVISGIASAALPGWGQLLNGQPVKAATFIAGLWLVAASWGLASPPIDRLFERFDLFMPPVLESFRSPLVRWTVLAVLWTLSLYDAVTSAESQR